MAFVMPCYHPLKALKSPQGITILRSDAQLFNLQLPCGQCTGCRLERSRQWALRCIHEASLHEFNSFVTLTYSDDTLPEFNSLRYKDFQLFMKRLRKHFNKPIRFYMCGEYGEQNGRPHYHAILFGLTFNDLTLWKRTSASEVIFRSATLEKLWPYGHSSVGAVTFQSAAYVARYVMKKVTGDAADIHYRVVDTDTGEVNMKVPEYNRMSLKPGIGAGWFNKYSSDVFPHDRVIHDGIHNRVPRYYDKLMSRVNPDLVNNIKSKRILDAMNNLHDNTSERLTTKEIVKNAQIHLLKRGLS